MKLESVVKTLEVIVAGFEKPSDGSIALNKNFQDEFIKLSNDSALKNANAVISGALAEPVERDYFSEYKEEVWITSDTSSAQSNKPDLQTFREKTGLSFIDATEMLYGVIGTNFDLRDWSKIMASKNPLEATRVATGQLYNSDLQYELGSDPSIGTEAFDSQLAQSSVTSQKVVRTNGNFAILQSGRESEKLTLVTKSGIVLRGAGTSEFQINRNAWLFGLEAPPKTFWA